MTFSVLQYRRKMLGRLRASIKLKPPHSIAFAHAKLENIDDDLKQYMHGRKFSERRDSVSREILMERKSHQEKFSSTKIDPELVRSLREIKLGSKKQLDNVYERIANQNGTYSGVEKQTNIAAGKLLL